MIAKWIKEKGILTKLLEKGIKFLVTKECKKIRNLKIDIISTSTQIFKGVIPKINISLLILSPIQCQFFDNRIVMSEL